MATLDLDLRAGLRSFALALTLSAGEEVVALTGPSGAGKTTVLRCVAGLHRPDSGRVACGSAVWFDSAAGVDLPPEARSVGYVPQHQALFPHLSVLRNVAFGGLDERAALGLLERVGIAHLAGERPARLSGGERGRVALARALAREPEVLLLDEPLAALDAHTRRAVRDELRAALRGAGRPALLVTHDYGDAAALADRIAVMVDGELRQLGRPEELVATPADAFVVALTGGTVLRGESDGSVVALDGGGRVAANGSPVGRVAVGLYPWDLAVSPGPGADGALRGVVTTVVPEGERVRVNAGAWWGEAPASAGIAVGDVVHAAVRRAHVLP